MTAQVLVFGLEIEGVVKRALTTIPNGYIAEARDEAEFVSDCWTVERDGSLRTDRATLQALNASHGELEEVELVSRPFTLEELDTILYDLEQNVFNGHALKDVLYFNSSAGAHIHVSSWAGRKTAKPRKVTRKSTGRMEKAGTGYDLTGKTTPRPLSLTDEVLEKVRARVREVMTVSARRRYFRDYAEQLPKLSLALGEYGSAPEVRQLLLERKYAEWNNRDDKGTHAEFRSFNLSGVKSWARLRKTYASVLKILSEELSAPTAHAHTVQLYPATLHESEQNDNYRVTVSRRESEEQLNLTIYNQGAN